MLGKQLKMVTNKILPDIPKPKNKRKNRTFCRNNSPTNKNKKRKENTTQCIVIGALKEIFDRISNRIDTINEINFYKELRFGIDSLSSNMYSIDDPEHQLEPIRIKIPENEPQRNSIDSNIGLYKHIIPNNSIRLNINHETQAKIQQKKSNKHIQLNSKKIIKYIIERRKSSSKLIPLPKTSTSLIEQVKAQDYYRERIIKQDQKKMLSIISTQPSKFKSPLKRNINTAKKEQYNYDYNGQKISLVQNPSIKNHNTMLKSLYKLNKENHTQYFIKQQSSFIKFSSRKKQRQFKDSKLLNQTFSLGSLQLSVKSRLQNEMIKNKLQFKTVFVD